MIRGEIWWADLGDKRPVVVIQDDAFNKSNIQTVIAASITTNLNLADAPGNVYLEKQESGLSKDGVVNISQISSLDKRRLTAKIVTLSQGAMAEIDYGLKLVLGIQ